MAWTDVVGSLPGAMRSLLTPSLITLPDREGKRVIYAQKPGAVTINYRLGAMILLRDLIHSLLDPGTNEIEISVPAEGESIVDAVESWNIVLETFPGASFIGYEKETKDG